MNLPIIIANWKMNFTGEEATAYVEELNKNIKDPDYEIIIAPPSLYLFTLKQICNACCYKLCAQNMYFEDDGPYTGEISAEMLEGKFPYCLVGHSERRIHFNETSDLTNKKTLACLKHNIIPILCIGENENEHNEEKTEEVIKSQLDIGLNGVESPENIIIAYEPVWAISTFRKDPTPLVPDTETLQSTYKYIKSLLEKKFGPNKIPILYGGSVDPDNAKEIFENTKYDGALVGGASLDVEKFTQVCQIIGETYKSRNL